MENAQPSQARLIVDAFGGSHALKRVLGHRHHTTISGWLRRGTVPQSHHVRIWEEAQARGIGLVPTDFLVPGVGHPSLIERVKHLLTA